MRLVKLHRKLPDAACEALMGKQLGTDDFDEALVFKGDDVRAVDADTGELIFCMRAKALPLQAAIAGMQALEKFNSRSDSRFLATKGKAAIVRHLKDGTLSKVHRINTVPPVNGVIGYFDRSQRFPFCRQTAFTQHHLVDFNSVYPLLAAVSAEFERQVPDRFAVQQAWWQKTAEDFRIPGTVFTTITVNKNYPTAAHCDAGDLKQGFSCLAVLRKGRYTGGYTLFPRYRAGVSLDSTDVLFMNAHEVHGNSPIVKLTEGAERLALVMYYRERMIDCLDAAGELKRAQNRQVGDKLHGARNPWPEELDE